MKWPRKQPCWKPYVLLLLHSLKESEGYYNELNLLNEKLGYYEQYQSVYLTLSDVDRIIKDVKFDIKQSIKRFIGNIQIAFEDVFLYFDTWKSGVVYRINLLRLDPDRRIFIDFITSIWNFFAYLVQPIVQMYG